MQTVLGVSANAGGVGALVVAFKDGRCGVAVDIPGQESVPSTFVQSSAGWTILGGNGGDAETELEMSSDLVTLASKSSNATVVSDGRLRADPGKAIVTLGVTSTGSRSVPASSAPTSPTPTASAPSDTIPAPGSQGSNVPSTVDQEGLESPSGNIHCVMSADTSKTKRRAWSFVECGTAEPERWVKLSASGKLARCAGSSCPVITQDGRAWSGDMWGGDNVDTPYGESESDRPFTCRSLTTGVECTRPNGKGFNIAVAGITAVHLHVSNGTGVNAASVDIRAAVLEGAGVQNAPSSEVTYRVYMLTADPTWAILDQDPTSKCEHTGCDYAQGGAEIYHDVNGTWTYTQVGQPCDNDPVVGLSSGSEKALCAAGQVPKPKIPESGTTDQSGAGQHTSEGSVCGHVEWDSMNMEVVAAGLTCTKAMDIAKRWATASSNPDNKIPYDNAGYFKFAGMICSESDAGSTSCGTSEAHIDYVAPGKPAAALPPPGTVF